jgi:hypothetical protein
MVKGCFSFVSDRLEEINVMEGFSQLVMDWFTQDWDDLCQDSVIM